MVVETSTPEVRKSRKAALELLVSNHHADCIGPCHQECPAGVDIQGYVALAALGKYHEAIRLIKEKNPLPAICGRVCTRPCEVSGCRRNLLDQAVGIDNIKRFLADLDLGMAQPFRPELAPKSGKRVAIVGAGPGGLACAYYLAIRGYAVHMFEAQPEAGGMLRYGIPEYRLPKEVLDSEIGQILDLGVKLSTNVFLGKDFTVAGLKNQGFDAVFLALGAWESSTMRVKNENVAGVIPGIELLKNVGLRRPVEVSGKVMVVGGGNTAIDCARTALRLGAGEVTLLYRRTRAEMPANPAEIEEAEREGVKLQFLVAPTQVMASEGRLTALECQRMELGEPDASGRRSPKPVRGSEFQIPCDYVIAAIGQSTTMRQLVGSSPAQFAPPGESLKLTRWETVQVDSGTFETTVEGVFAGGDVVTGAATVVEAVAAGRQAAYAIDRFITTGKAEREPVQFTSKKSLFGKPTADDLRSTEKIPHRHMPVLPPEERLSGFAEVELGYRPEDVSRESARCLECGCSAMFSCDLRRLATEYGADAKTFLGEAKQYRVDRSHPLIELDPAKCILCGRCIRMCSEVVGKSAYGFINRGFGTIVRPALGGSLLDTECVSCGLCIGTCPTGAIAAKVPLAKPGPWQTTPVVSVCHFCGVGCTLELHSHENTFISPRRIEKSKNTMGGHCKKGLFGFDYVHASDRVRKPRVRSGRDLQETTLDDAIQYTGMRWKELSAKLPGDAMAVFVSPRLTNEEIYLAQKLARVVLHTHNVASFANLANDDHFFPEIVSTATYADLLGAQVIVVLSAQLAGGALRGRPAHPPRHPQRGPGHRRRATGPSLERHCRPPPGLQARQRATSPARRAQADRARPARRRRRRVRERAAQAGHRNAGRAAGRTVWRQRRRRARRGPVHRAKRGPGAGVEQGCPLPARPRGRARLRGLRPRDRGLAAGPAREGQHAGPARPGRPPWLVPRLSVHGRAGHHRRLRARVVRVLGRPEAARDGSGRRARRQAHQGRHRHRRGSPGQPRSARAAAQRPARPGVPGGGRSLHDPHGRGGARLSAPV